MQRYSRHLHNIELLSKKVTNGMLFYLTNWNLAKRIIYKTGTIIKNWTRKLYVDYKRCEQYRMKTDVLKRKAENYLKIDDGHKYNKLNKLTRKLKTNLWLIR